MYDDYAGPLPEKLNTRLELRDLDPLPEGALVKFQDISRSRDPRLNYRWLLYEDGRWFLARHSESTEEYWIPFDTELPQSPTKVIEIEVVKEVIDQLRAADFLNQPPYQSRWTRNGAFYVVTARLDDHEHEVIYESVVKPPVEYLIGLVESYE